MRVRIVCYEDVETWIVGKFALRLCEHLEKQGVAVDIKKFPDPAADINHHLLYGGYDGKKNSLDTVMITHIDEEFKVQLLARQFINASMGICMSSDTLQKLTRLALPREKLCYVNPAHDGLMRPRKMVVGITSKVQPTGCKREDILKQLANHISSADFKFKIMGSGWDAIIEVMRSRGIEVDYYDHFDYDIYHALMPNLDYYLYFGQDEGSMGFLDALTAGVQTIVTPQGFHLDAVGGIVHSFNGLQELANTFHSISERRTRLVNAVSTWTWSAYAHKHLLIWTYLLNQKNKKPFPFEMRQELISLGVAVNRKSAVIQTGMHRALRKGRRVASKVKSGLESWFRFTSTI